jgi:hypothetical protein
MGEKPTDESSERAPAPSPASVKPVKKKVAEGPDNLRRREAWFQRRTGGRVKRPAS